MWKARAHTPMLSFYHNTHTLEHENLTHMHMYIHILYTQKYLWKEFDGKNFPSCSLSQYTPGSLVHSAFRFTVSSFNSIVPHFSVYFIPSSKSNSSLSYTRASSCAFCFHSLCLQFYTTLMRSRQLGQVAFKVWEVKFIVKEFPPKNKY